MRELHGQYPGAFSISPCVAAGRSGRSRQREDRRNRFRPASVRMPMPHRMRLPVFLSIAVSSSVGCGGLAGTTTQEPEGALPAPFRPVPEAQGMRFNSGMAERERLVIRDGAAWADVWSRIASPFRPAPPVPAVDFDRNVVIVASMGAQGSSGYAIAVDEVQIAGGEARVSVTEESPASGCIVLAEITDPVAVVAGPRFPGQSTFVERTSRHECR